MRPRRLLEKIEQVVRLIRSKGVGVYFVTQNPLDIPETVLGQLGNRVQHALRAFTPRDQKAVKPPRETLRQIPSRRRKQRSPNWPWAKRWFRFSMKRAGPRWWSARSYCRRLALGPLSECRAQRSSNHSVIFWPLRADGRSGIRLRKAQGACSAGRENNNRGAGKGWQSEVTGTLSALGKSAARAMGTQVRPGDHARSFRIDIWIFGAENEAMNGPCSILRFIALQPIGDLASCQLDFSYTLQSATWLREGSVASCSSSF